jgi:hypothetical protein
MDSIGGMAGREPAVEFRRDLLLFLDRALLAAGDALWLPGRPIPMAQK